MRLRCVDHVIAGVPCCIKHPMFGKGACGGRHVLDVYVSFM